MAGAGRLGVLLLALVCLLQLGSSSVDWHANVCKASTDYDLPVVNQHISDHVKKLVDRKDPETGKYIPQIGWIAVRNASEERAAHMLGPTGFVARNSKWKIHFCGNEEKDEFMNTVYNRTSILWAYNVLNPIIGTAKAEIWRLAVLYYHGGMYLDDDANLATSLDEIVRPTDKFIVGKESYNWTDHCFTDDYALSNHSLSLRFGAKNLEEFFENRYFFNWALFSMPGNPLVLRIMQHIVALIKHEYMHDSKIKMSPQDHPGKLLMCASTFPITLVAREMLLEGAEEAIGLRVGGEFFREYGGNMKAWNNDHRSDRWVKVMNKKRAPYLCVHAPPRPELFEGKVIKGAKHSEIFLVQRQKKRSFPDFSTFLAMKFTIQDVHVVPAEVLHAIPTGDPLPVVK